MKLLVVLAAVALLVWLLGGKRRREVQQHQQQQRQQKAAPARVAGPQEMVRCARCDLHLPAVDAIAGSGGRMFCCIEHRRDAD